MSNSRKVVLFLPPYAGKILGPPLGLLSLAGSLREAGYAPHIIDGALDPDYRRNTVSYVQFHLLPSSNGTFLGKMNIPEYFLPEAGSVPADFSFLI